MKYTSEEQSLNRKSIRSNWQKGLIEYFSREYNNNPLLVGLAIVILIVTLYIYIRDQPAEANVIIAVFTVLVAGGTLLYAFLTIHIINEQKITREKEKKIKQFAFYSVLYGYFHSIELTEITFGEYEWLRRYMVEHIYLSDTQDFFDLIAKFNNGEIIDLNVKHGELVRDKAEVKDLKKLEEMKTYIATIYKKLKNEVNPENIIY